MVCEDCLSFDTRLRAKHRECDQLRDKLKYEERSGLNQKTVAIKLRSENTRLKSLLQEALPFVNPERHGSGMFASMASKLATQIRNALGEWK